MPSRYRHRNDELVERTETFVTMEFDSGRAGSYIPSLERALPAPASRPTSSFIVADDYLYDDAFADDVANTSVDYSSTTTRRDSHMSTLTKAKKRKLEAELDQMLTPLAKEWNKDFRLTELTTVCSQIVDNVASRAEEAVVSSPVGAPHLRFNQQISGGEELESLRLENQGRNRASRIRRSAAEIEEEKLKLDLAVMKAHLENSLLQSAHVPTGLRSQAGSLNSSAMTSRGRPASAPPGSVRILTGASDQETPDEIPACLRRRSSALHELQSLPRSDSPTSLPDVTESRPPPTRAPRSFSFQNVGLESVPELPSPVKSSPGRSPAGRSLAQPRYARAPTMAEFYGAPSTAELNRRFGPVEGRRKEKRGFARKAFEKVVKKVENVVTGKKDAPDADDVFAPSKRK